MKKDLKHELEKKDAEIKRLWEENAKLRGEIYKKNNDEIRAIINDELKDAAFEDELQFEKLSMSSYTANLYQMTIKYVK